MSTSKDARQEAIRAAAEQVRSGNNPFMRRQRADLIDDEATAEAKRMIVEVMTRYVQRQPPGEETQTLIDTLASGLRMTGSFHQRVQERVKVISALRLENKRLYEALAFAASALESGELHAAPLVRAALRGDDNWRDIK